MKTATKDTSPLAGIVHSSREVIHNLAGQVRTSAAKPGRLLDSRHHNELLRQLGQLHYEAHRTEQVPNQTSIDQLTQKLDANRDNDDETSEADNDT